MIKKFLAISAVIVICAIAVGLITSVQGRRPLNLIVISIDTLRADHLGSYGYGRPTSPHIDEFAKKNVLFENAVSVASWTLPAHMTLFTGLYPSSHGVTNSKKKLSTHTEMLAERLKKRGYHTYAFTGGVNVGRRFGFARGFDVYRDDEKVASGDLRGFGLTVHRAKNKLLSLPKDQPYFMFLHTYDVHCPYTPPEKFAAMFATADEEALDANACRKEGYRQFWQYTPGNVSYFKNRYDGAIRTVDEQFAELISFLKERGDLDHTVIVLLSDHGEEFYEHGRVGHGGTLNRETLLIPLIVHAPGVTARRVATQVSLVDVFPTVMALLDLPPWQHAQGSSLVPMLQGKDLEALRPFQFSELDHERSLRSRFDTTHHLIHDLGTKQDALFDYTKDPTEQDNLAPKEPDLLSKLRAPLLEFSSQLPAQQTESAAAPSKKEIEKLKSLGYL